ncbi:MAG: hypothetical protein ACI8ZN_001980 [Bacteroidia bacterium]|jgi:hypothetical protein
MKNYLSLSLCLFLGFAILQTGCKEDDPVDTTPTDTDLRNKVAGEYSSDLNVYNARTGDLQNEYVLDLKILINAKDDTRFDFYQDGLFLFMSGYNLRAISGGYAFDIPEQEVKNFGTLNGKKYINVDGDANRYHGVFYTATNKITVYCERKQNPPSDYDLFEFLMTKK